MGKEIAEILRDRNFPAVDIRLLDDDQSLGQLEAIGDEMTFIQSIRPEQFEHVDFTFFSSDPRATRAKWETARDHGNTIIDSTGALEEAPGATIRSPWVEREMIERGLGQPVPPQLQPGPVVVAHSAATALAMLALRAEKFAKVERMIVDRFRARLRVRTKRYGRTARADRQPARLPGFAEECFRYPGRLQHGCALRTEITPLASKKFPSAFSSTIANWRPALSSRRW